LSSLKEHITIGHCPDDDIFELTKRFDCDGILCEECWNREVED
jgi:hypothetical protein